MNGTLYDRAPLPAEVTLRAGTSLGISAVCHLREDVLLRSHLAVLGRAADTLGYAGFDLERAVEAVSAAPDRDAGEMVVALVPTPRDHKAAAPGDDWMLVVQPSRTPVSTAPLRVATSAHRRNHRSPTARLVLLGDVELLDGARRAAAAGCDELLWLNLDDAVACIGNGAVFAATDGRLVTPRLADGVPESAWRAACIGGTGATEGRIDRETLRAATSVACVLPWGAARSVGWIDDVRFADHSLAARLGDVLSGLGGRW